MAPRDSPGTASGPPIAASGPGFGVAVEPSLREQMLAKARAFSETAAFALNCAQWAGRTRRSGARGRRRRRQSSLGLRTCCRAGRAHGRGQQPTIFEHLGLSFAPDLDTVMYTLGGLANRRGWGAADETLERLDEIGKVGAKPGYGWRQGSRHPYRAQAAVPARGRTAVICDPDFAQTLRDRHGDRADVRRAGAHGVRPRWRSRLQGLVRRVCTARRSGAR